MSWAFITAIKENPKQSYVELLNSIRDVLETKYTQKPQLSCSHPLGMSVIVKRRDDLLTYCIRYQSIVRYVDKYQVDCYQIYWPVLLIVKYISHNGLPYPGINSAA